MIVANRLLGIPLALTIVLLASLPLEAQMSWDFMEPIDVASNDFGRRCPRLVLDASGNPVVFLGKTNKGMFVVTSDNGSFNELQLVLAEPGILLSDAEGPDVEQFFLPGILRRHFCWFKHKVPEARPCSCLVSSFKTQIDELNTTSCT